jgi:sulfur relay (sulfurtransferase) complex TusBCD TusD component (DsrE family)
VARYVLIESRDPFEYGDSLYIYDLAGDLAGKGNDVTLFLVQNGVLTTRRGVKNNPLAALRQRAPSVSVSVDDFSLRERGISQSTIVEGVSVSNIDDLVDLLVQDGSKIVWH